MSPDAVSFGASHSKVYLVSETFVMFSGENTLDCICTTGLSLKGSLKSAVIVKTSFTEIELTTSEPTLNVKSAVGDV